MKPTNPLDEAIQQQNIQFHNKDSWIHDKSNRGNTPLHLAAQEGNLNSVASLLSPQTNLNVTNLDGQTPLHLAAINGHSQVVKLLWENGADPFSKSTSTG